MTIRQPIISVLGHIDHGKTTLLDSIRTTSIGKKEPGHITQHIGASEVPAKTIKEICGNLLKKMGVDLKIPGLLFIDTPGHAAFVNLRKRGGSIADLAVLVVDINGKFQPQTIEALEILKAFKTPFIIAASKIDLIPGWKKTKESSFAEALKQQSESVRKMLDERVYTLLSELSKFGFDSERFDRIEDYKKNVAIIPVSGITGEGVAELLMLLSGLSQRFLGDRLVADIKGSTRGVVLEVKEEKGLGKTIDVIIYDGKIDEGDTIIIGAFPEPIIAKVRCLLKPKPLREIREKYSKFDRVDHISAAAGVKVVSPDLEGVIAGMPIAEAAAADSSEAIEMLKESIKGEIEDVICKGKKGIVVKADSLGSLEALRELMSNEKIDIKICGIGDVNKQDVIELESEEDSNRAIFTFNVGVTQEAQELITKKKIMLFSSNIIYKLVEDYNEWKLNVVEKKKIEKLEKLMNICKVQVLPGYIFRQSDPAIVGVEVLAGKLKPGTVLIRTDGVAIGKVKSIQDSGETLEVAEVGKQAATSITGATYGKDFKETDLLYSNLSEDEFSKLKELKSIISENDRELIKEIVDIKRKKHSLWGI